MRCKEVHIMSERKFHLLLGCVALLSGAILYALYRENTYVGVLLDRIFKVSQLRNLCSGYGCSFFRYYFPDFLWGFAFYCGLCVIWQPRTAGCWLCAGGAFACGLVWEMLQYTGVLRGTGDVQDIIMYLFAGLIGIFMDKKES